MLSDEEVEAARGGLRKSLAEHGVDTENLASTVHRLKSVQLTGGSGGIVDVYYDAWAMRLRLHANVFGVMSQLWGATWASNASGFESAYAGFNASRGYAYIDRAGFRVPTGTGGDALWGGRDGRTRPLQNALHPHMDMCPLDVWGENAESPMTRWRPIQASLALTDVTAAERGGFVAARGFLRQFDEHFSHATASSSDSSRVGGSTVHCAGQFSALRVRRLGRGEDDKVEAMMEHIHVEAGSLVLWDWRTPHTNRCVARHAARRERRLGANVVALWAGTGRRRG